MMKSIESTEKKIEQCYINYKEKLEEVNEEKEKIGFRTSVRFLIPVSLAVVIAILGLMMLVQGDDAREACLFFGAITIILLGIANIIYTISYNTHDREKNLQSSKAIYFNEVIPLYVKYKQSADELNELYGNEEYLEIKRHILDCYCNIEAMQFFIDAIEQRKADTQKELYRLYDQHVRERKRGELE